MYFTLADLVTGIFKGYIKEGEMFIALSNHDKLVYTGEALAWVTIEGYVSTPLSVTAENITELYKRV